MKNIRVIARLDIKGPNLVKGIQFEGLRKIGNPGQFAYAYYKQGIDEILYIDTVASLYNRNNLQDIIKKTTESIFVPITVGGGIRNVEDVKTILRLGADKVAINTAAIKKPELITQVAEVFGSQCLVLSIQAKKISNNRWEVYYDNGREKTGIDVVDWALKGVELGAGEILVTSVDMEGTRKGFDYELIKVVSEIVPIPVIAGGGCGSADDFVKVVYEGMADSVAIASLFHYNQITIDELKDYAFSKGINVRRCHKI